MFSVTIREKSGQVYTFHFDKPEIMIGRVKGNDVILPKQNISKRHSLVRARGDRFVIEDLGSTNGTYVNGHRIASPVEITSDDKVYLGDFVMQFFDLGEHLEVAAPDVPEVPDRPPTPPPAPANDFGLDLRPPPAPGEVAHLDQSPPRDPRNDDYEPNLPDNVAGSSVMGVGGSENTMAELDSMAAVAKLVAERKRSSPKREAAVAADDPLAALDEIDDRMTGPVGGMADLFAADSAPSPALELDMGDELAPDMSADLGPALLADLEAASAPTPSERAQVPEPAQVRPAPVAVPVDAGEPPDLSGDHHAAVAALYDRALDELHPELPRDAASLSDAQWSAMEQRVVGFVDAKVRDSNLSPEVDLDLVKRDLIYEIAGLGPLEAMLDDAGISAIEVNGPAQIYVVRDGVRSRSVNRFSAQPALLAAAERLIRATGTVMPQDAAHAEGALADGTSVRVVWPPLCPNGPALLVRKPRATAPTVKELVARGQVTERAAERLLDAMAAARSIALCGPIGSGRRTMLNALALELPNNSRVVVAEHGVRVKLEVPHVVRIDTASAEVVGSPLRVARSLRPDRMLVCAEGRGELAAMVGIAGDGLPPWIGSFFAHGGDDLLRRAIDGVALLHPGVSVDVARSCVATALDVVASFSIEPDGRSVLDSVGEVSAEGGGLVVHSLLAQ